jgi:hypothetical protein
LRIADLGMRIEKETKEIRKINERFQSLGFDVKTRDVQFTIRNPVPIRVLDNLIPP